MSRVPEAEKPTNISTSVDILHTDAIFLVKKIRVCKTSSDLREIEDDFTKTISAIIKLLLDLGRVNLSTLTFRAANSRLKYAASFLRREYETKRKRILEDEKPKPKAKGSALNASLVAKFIIKEAMKLNQGREISTDLTPRVSTVEIEKEGVSNEKLVALLEQHPDSIDAEDIDFLEGMDQGL
jgi:hypothetical protein